MKTWQNLSIIGVFFVCFGIITVFVGCSAVVSQPVLPHQDPGTNEWIQNPEAQYGWRWKPPAWPFSPNPAYESRAGIAYFLPMGLVQIVAIRTESYVTNCGVVSYPFGTNAYGQTLYLTNTVSMTQMISNTVSTTLYTNIPAPPLSALVYSNTLIQSNTVVGPIATNSLSLLVRIGTNTNPESITIVSNAIATTATSFSQSTAVSNQPPQFSLISTSNSTITTVYSSQPRVTTNYTYNVTISVNYQADRTEMFLLRPQMDILHDDSANITVDGNGLLSSINASNSDQTGNIMVALGQTAAESFELAGGMPASTGPPEAEQTLELNSDLANANTLIVQYTKTALPNDLAHYSSYDDFTNLGSKIDQYELLQEKSQKDTNTEVEQIETSLLLRNAIAGAVNTMINNLDETQFIADHNLNLSRYEELIDRVPSARPGFRNLVNRKIVEDAYPNIFVKFVSSKSLDEPNPLPYPTQINIIFDPFKRKDLTDAKNTLAHAGLTIENADDFSRKEFKEWNTNWFLAPTNGLSGIFYRPPIPYQLRIRDSHSNVVTATVLLPNKAPIFNLPLDKASFVSTISAVTLTNGFIGSYSFSKPSQLMALATCPLTLISDITGSVTNLLQFRINLATGQNALQSAYNTSQAQLPILSQQTAEMLALSNSITIIALKQQLTNALSGTNVVTSPP